MNVNNHMIIVMAVGVMTALTACADDQNGTSNSPIVHESLTQKTSSNNTEQPISEKEQVNMWMTINGNRFEVMSEDNATAHAFAAQLPLTLNMEDLNSNEKHAQLPNALPTNASRVNTIHNGDIMLYGSSTLVVFYKSFSSSYSYTRIGRVSQPDKLADILGQGNVQIEFSRD
ncbi:cyclophilin-like fold protein [Psychrobacter aquimaris]|uniref:cyclophilin-like fold protein n=1 Tax=Psychrobacter aquimaris TaxID=292733 RepID=UPI003FD13CFE